MTTTDAPPESRASLPLTAPRLPGWAPALVAVVALGAAGLLALLAGWGITALATLTAVIFIVAPTLFYVIAYAPNGGVSTFGWIFVAFGVLLDLGTGLGGGRAGSRRAWRAQQVS